LVTPGMRAATNGVDALWRIDIFVRAPAAVPQVWPSNGVREADHADGTFRPPRRRALAAPVVLWRAVRLHGAGRAEQQGLERYLAYHPTNRRARIMSHACVPALGRWKCGDNNDLEQSRSRPLICVPLAGASSD
jgi:hypothetical protein